LSPSKASEIVNPANAGTSFPVFVIDDDASIRKALTRLIKSAGYDVTTFASAREFLDCQRPDEKPGCLLLDVRMPGLSGLDLQAELQNVNASLPIVFMTGYGDIPMSVKAMKAGAVDFIEKPFDQEAILSAVQAALDRAGGGDNGDGQAIKARLGTLSERERQVLDGLIAGHPNKTIAYDLGISPRTVEVYRANLMTKMTANSLSDLVRMAMQAGILGETAKRGR